MGNPIAVGIPRSLSMSQVWDNRRSSFSFVEAASPNSGVTLHYGFGTRCGGIGKDRETFLNILCDPNADPIVVHNMTESRCTYNFWLSSAYACPSRILPSNNCLT